MIQRELTAQETREEEEMRLFLENNPEVFESTQSAYNPGTGVVSHNDIINSQNSLEEFTQEEEEPASILDDSVDEKKKENEVTLEELEASTKTEQEETEQRFKNSPVGKDNPIDLSGDKEGKMPGDTKPDSEKTKLELQTKKQNEEIVKANESELERYYSELEPESIKLKQDTEDKIKELKNNEDNYEEHNFTVKTADGPQYRSRTIMKASIKAEINKLKAQNKEAIRPAVEQFNKIIDQKLTSARELQKSDDVSYWEHLYEEAHLSEVLYEKAKDISEGHLNNSGMWRALGNGITDEDFYTLGSANLDTMGRLLFISNKINKGKELDKGEQMLVDAYATYTDAQQLALGEMYTLGQGTAASIPFMVQFAATRGTAVGVEKTVSAAVQKYLKNKLKRTISAKTIKVASKFAGAFAGSTAQAVRMPVAYESVLERRVGEFQVDRGTAGKIEQVYVGDKLYDKVKQEGDERKKKVIADPENYEGGVLTTQAEDEIRDIQSMVDEAKPTSWAKAAYLGIGSTMLEVATERIGGESILKGVKKLGLRNPFHLPEGKFTQGFESFKTAVGYQGFIPELLEEEMIIPMDALLIGDSKFSDLWDGQQQLQLIGQVGLVTMGMGIGQTGLGLRGRLRNKEFYAERKKMFKHISDIRKANPNELDNLLDFASTSTDIAQMKWQEQKLRDEGKNKEANEFGNKILYNQILKAFDTHTIDQFQSALEGVSQNPDTDPEMKKNVTQAMAQVNTLKRTYEKFRHLPNSSTILRYQANKLLARKASQELDQELTKLAPEVLDDIAAYAEYSGKKLPDFTVETMFDAPSTENLSPEQQTQQDTHQKFLHELEQANIGSVNNYFELLSRKSVIESIGADSRMLFNEAITPEFQQKLKDETFLRKKINKDRNLRKAIEDKDDQKIKKELSEITTQYKGTLSKEKVAEINKEYRNMIALSRFNEELTKKKQIAEKAQNELDAKDYAKAKTERTNIEAKRKEELSSIEDTEENKKAIEAINKEYDSQIAEVNEQLAVDISSRRDIERTKEEGYQDVKAQEINQQLEAEFQDVANSLSEGDTTFDLPKELSKDLSQEQKDGIKAKIENMYSILEKQLDKKPTFKDLVTKFTESTSLEQAEEYYNVITLGWTLNNYKKTNFKGQYNKIFDPFKIAAQSLIADNSLFGPTTREELENQSEDVIDKQSKKETPITFFTEENVPVKTNQGQKITEPILKLGFLAIKYEEVLDDNGNMQKVSIGTDLISEGVIDVKELLNPDKYGVGTELIVAVPPAEVLENIYISYRNAKGEKVSEKFNTWLERKIAKDPAFKESKEYLERVPVLVYSQEGTPLAYIHDTQWYDSESVGFKNDPPKQAEIIEKSRKETSELRTKIIKEGLNVIRVSNRSMGRPEKVPTHLPAWTLNEANPQTIVGISKTRGTVETKDGTFENSERTLLNKDAIQSGHTYDIRRIGINEDGKQTWFAYPVLRGNLKDNYSISDEVLNTMNWALAAHLRLKDYTSYSKNAPIQVGEEQANKIVDDIIKETGWDISTRNGIYEFMRQYIAFGGMEYKVLSKQLFSKNKTYAKNFRQHTSKEALQVNPNMVTISEEGIVTPLNKDYNTYLKDTLQTNIKSFNAGTQEDPIYVTSIQPKINFTYEKAEPSMKEQVQKAVEEVKEELKGETSVEAKAAALINKLGFGKKTFFDLPTEIQDTSIIENIFNTTEGLSVIEEYQLIDFLFNKISNSIDIRKGASVDKSLLLSQMQNSYEIIIMPSRTEAESILKQVKELYDSKPKEYPNLLPYIKDLTRILSVYDNIKDNWKSIEEKALEKLYRYTGIKEGTLEEDTQVSLRVKNHSKLSLEENGKDKASYRLRRFFAGVQQRTAKGEVKKGFLNLPVYVGFNEVYNTIAQILSSPVETESDFKTMIAKLEEAKDTHKWLPDVISKLQGANDQIRKEFVYNYTKHALSMKFAMYSVDGRGRYSLQMYDTNAHEITRLIQSTWKNNFKIGKLVNSEQEFYSINRVQAQNALDEFDEWGEDPQNIDKNITREWLQNYFGIVMSQDAYNSLVEKGIYYKGEHIEYKDMFAGSDTVFGLLNTYLKKITEANEKGEHTIQDTEFEENESNHPFSNMSGVLKSLAILESKFTNQAMTLSFRDNGKSIFGLTPNKFATDRVLKLKQYDENGINEFVDKLQKLSFSSDSYMLELLQIEKDFRTKFGVDHIGITALKQFGKKASFYSNVTDLNSIDHDVVKLTGFQDLKQGEVKATVDSEGKLVAKGNGIGMRMARMFLPTMSDKNQMLLLNTGVFSFLKDKRKSFETDTEGNLQFTQTVKNLLYNQLVKPELKRIIKFQSAVHRTNIKDYNLAAQIFNMIPALNNIKDKDGIRIIELIASDPEVFNMEWVEANFRDQIDNVLKTVIDANVKEKADLWEEAIERNPKTNQIRKVKFFDTAYLAEGSGTLDEKYEMALYDFVMNSFVVNANVFSAIAGDPALYSQDKLFKGFAVDNSAIQTLAEVYGKEKAFRVYESHGDFLDELNKLYKDGIISKKLYTNMKEDIKPIPQQASDNDFLELAEKSGVNLGKRLALLIAPGSKIANSKDALYTQVFMKDAIHIAENTEYLIELYYGKEALAEVKSDIINYYLIDNEAEKEDIRKSLSNKFPKLADYFDIEATDAQELTTVSEHINTLEGQGRIPVAILKEIREKLEKGEDLDKKHLGFVLQPIKPVHTGQILDEVQDVLRTVYIKSSSYPLLPQATKGRKLDILRKKLEALEKEKGMPVRASYQTANKVGAIEKPIEAFEEHTIEQLEEASLVLSRNDFRIQQDVPFKSDTKKHDKVSMGTQIFKLLFGDGMLDQEGFEINGKTMNGRELYEYFNEVFGGLIELKKKALFRELHLDEDGLPIDEKKSITKLQKLLQKEARDRGYPRQDIEGLTFIEKKDAQGRPYYDFKLPLWISSNSNRYEALLNAIVTNRLISQKMPGNSFVVGSEEGYEVTESMDGIDTSKIIHVGEFSGGVLKGVQRKDGIFTKAQILIPSKFKNNQGKLIDLYEKGRGREFKYLKRGKNRELILDKKMISPELLQNFTFRTPTSSHVSGSVVDIVGILPPENGDLMIVPKNFTKQKGLDYDVDKETAYQLHHIYNSRTGVIETLSELHREKAVKGLRRALEDTKGIDRDNPETRLVISIFGAEAFEEDILEKEASIEEKISNRIDNFNIKLLENEFIKVHMSVFSNPNDEVQKKINKVLSMSFARGQADNIDELTTKDIDKSTFTILSDGYQRDKMALGAAGKMAIGVYSNYVTFHGLAQQVSGDKISLVEMDEMDNLVNKVVTIGNFTSTGELGNLKTLDGERYISEVLSERQNTATDNEKEQILGRVNVNSITINVDSLLSLLGFDKGEMVNGKETSIPYLFLSQPIIKEYVKRVQAYQAITADFNFGAEEKIRQELINKYMEESLIDGDGEITTKKSEDLTAENLVNEIGKEQRSGIQVKVFLEFLALNEYARNLGGVQSVVNTSDLGKSIIEANDKYRKLSLLPTNTLIQGTEKLIGDYIEVRGNTKPEGYYTIGNYYIKPNTPQGHIVVNGIKVGNDLWNDYFPYSDENFNAVVSEIEAITNAESKSDRKKIEAKFDIFKEIKRYLNSDSNNGIFTEPTSVERKRLFIDSKENESLASYMNMIKNTGVRNLSPDLQEGVHNLQTNRLFSKFTFELNSNGEPSLVKYNNTASENFDEDYLYTAIAEMTINQETLPDKNGQPYDTRKLAADMVAYAYLEGGVQEAIQFAKYIPIEYLETIGFAKKVQEYSPKIKTNIFKRTLGIKKLTEQNSHETHTFVKQYIQHNPQIARQYSKADEARFFRPLDSKKINWSIGFTLFDVEESPKFITRKNITKSKRKQDKFSLYQHVGNGDYRKISILGVHGMNEYELGNEDVHSLLDSAEPFKVKSDIQRVSKGKVKQSGDIFNLKDGNLSEILDNIERFKGKEYKHFDIVASILRDAIKNNISLEVGDTTEGGREQSAGRTYLKPSGAIRVLIDNSTMSDDNDNIARVVMHELTHSVTVQELGKYFDLDGTQIVKSLPTHVSRLLRVFNATKKELGPELEVFTQKLKKKRSKEEVDIKKEELKITYAGTSIFEFVAVALTEPSFQKRMNEIEYASSKDTIWNKFKKAVVSILANTVGMGNINEGTITYEALSSIIEFIDIENKETKDKKPIFEKAPQNTDTNDEAYLKSIEKEMKERGYEDDTTDDINQQLNLPMAIIDKLPELCS